MKNLLFLFFTILSVSSIFAQNDKRLKGLDKELNEILEATKAPGFAVAMSKAIKSFMQKVLGIEMLKIKS